jgi:cytochrome b
MYYVEYLRAVRALRIVAIVLGLVLVAALLMRLSWGKIPTTDDSVNAMEHSRTAHVTRKALPNGGTETVIDDPKRGVHAVVERHGGSVTSLVTGRPESEVTVREKVRNVRATPQPRDAAALTAVSYASFDIAALLWFAIPLGLFAATLLAGPLSKENNGHLELAWTKPVSRERYAVSAMLVDVTAVAVAQIAAAVTLMLAWCFWDVPKFSFDAVVPSRVLFALVAPVAWYACLTAFSTSLKRGPGAVLGIGWVVAVLCPSIAGATRNSSTPVGRSLHAIFHTVSYFDPITFIWFPVDGAPTDPARATAVALLALAVLAILYLGAAVLQWRRVEP